MDNKTKLSNYALLVGLCHQQQSVARVSNRYPDLYRFRQQIEEAQEGPHHQPYQARRKKTAIYRTIFFTIGFLFICLFGATYTQNMSWTSSLFFENSILPKILLYTLCLGLAFFSFTLGLSIRTEKEAVTNLIHRAQKKLKGTYVRKLARLNVKMQGSVDEQIKASQSIKEIYRDTWEKILESQEVALTLMGEISQAKNIESPVDLFNQAILELNDRLNFLIQRFKNILNEDFDL